MKKNVLCIAYGSHLMGMGHLYRCRLIFDVLKASGEYSITLVTKGFSEAADIIKTLNVDHVINLPAQVEDESLIACLGKLNDTFDYCIVDELNSSIEKMAAVRKKAKRILSFDDKGTGAAQADVLINVLYPNTPPHANETNDYEYLLIKNNQETKSAYHFRKEVKNILINQGGADTWGAIPDFIKDLEKTQSSYNITLLLGPAFQHFTELESALKDQKKHNYNVIHKTTQMGELFLASDLAILGGGNTIFEALSIGIPVIASTREEKELITIDRLKKEDMITGESQLYNGSGIAEIVENLANDMSRREDLFHKSRKCFGYNGLDNILKLLLAK